MTAASRTIASAMFAAFVSAMILATGNRPAVAADADADAPVASPSATAAFPPEPKPEEAAPPAPTPSSGAKRRSPAPLPIASRFGAFAAAAPASDEPTPPREHATVPTPTGVRDDADDATPDDETPTPVPDATTRCDGPALLASNVSRCDTPRNGVLSGGYFGIDFGVVAPKGSAADRVGLGDGFGGVARLGAELWDQLILGVGVGFFQFGDNRATSELVVTCTTVNGVTTGCDDSPHLASSSITAGDASVEAGYQRRFRPSHGVSLSVGGLTGFMQGFGRMKRGVDCQGCSSTSVEATAGGVYVSPFFRVTVGRAGTYAMIVRTQWFVTGDLLQFTSLGFEMGAP
jgi:hypothetical protein